MRSHILLLGVLGVLTACSGGSGDPDVDASASAADAPPPGPDAATQAPAMITISGTAGEGGLGGTTPVMGVTIRLYRTSNPTTPVATDSTDAQGGFSFTVATGGVPVDGYLEATMPGSYLDSYVYPSSPFAADSTGNDPNMITRGNFDLLSTFAQGDQQAGQGFIALVVVDATGAPVAGATVASSPASGTYRYDDDSGFPSSTATVTASDGFAFMFNVPGQVTVSAMKSGHSFRSHPVTAHPDAFTTTSIAP